MSRTTIARMQWTAATTVLGLLLFGGCSTDSSTGPDGDRPPPRSPGTGTGTLQVMAAIDIEDTGAGDPVTDFWVTVKDASGTPVSDAVVTFEEQFGSRTLPEDEATAGVYVGSRAGYVSSWYRLNVRAGSGELVGLTEWTPSAHSITHPASHDTVTADAILNVRWTAPEPAVECRLTTRDYDSSWINGDTRTLWVPGVGNPPRDDQRITVLRRNTQFSEAGLAGSRLSVSFRRSVEPIIAR